MYMTKKHKQELAGLFNSIVISRESWFRATDDGRHEDANHYHLDYAKEVIELADRYGIELCSLEMSKDFVERAEEVQA